MLRLISATAMMVALVISCSGAKADPPSGNGNSAKACVGGNGEGWKVLNPCTTGTAAPTPTPVPIAAYAPSYIYEGNIAGGGTNVMSTSPNTYVLGNTTNGAIAGQIAQAAQIRYMEDFAGGTSSAGFGTFFDPVNVCRSNALYCNPGWYNSAILQHCDTTTQTTFYNNVAGLSGDSAYLHIPSATSPYTLSQRQYTTAGSCTNPTGATSQVTLYENPGSSAGYSQWMSIWYQNASYINSRSWYFTMWDNSTYIAAQSAEYATSAAGQAAFMQDVGEMYAAAAPYKIVMNGGGSGGTNWRNLTDAAHIGQGCSGFICSAPDSLCAANTAGNIVGQFFERPLTNKNVNGNTLMQNNLPYLINSVAEYYADSGCANVDLVDLEQPFDGSGDNHNLRDLEKAVAMLLQPSDYDGSAGHRAFLQWLYNDCPGGGTVCTNQVPIYPEYGLQFVPKTSFGKYTAGNDCDGNGTGSSSSGGAHALLIATNSTDINGCTGALYGRPGTCYKYGASIGPCFVIINQSNASWNMSINNSVCAVAGNPTCDKYGHIWQYTGTGPQTCLKDQGTNLGTSSATCTSSNYILNSAANGGQSAWGESSSVPTSIPQCDYTVSGTYVTLTHNCVLILLSQ